MVCLSRLWQFPWAYDCGTGPSACQRYDLLPFVLVGTIHEIHHQAGSLYIVLEIEKSLSRCWNIEYVVPRILNLHISHIYTLKASTYGWGTGRLRVPRTRDWHRGPLPRQLRKYLPAPKSCAPRYPPDASTSSVHWDYSTFGPPQSCYPRNSAPARR